MNRLGRAALNSPARAAAQRRWVMPALARLLDGPVGEQVLEVGCGGGQGSQLLVDELGADRVDAIDLDPAMVQIASRRLRPEGRIRVRLGDMVATGAPDASYDAVVDLGAMHLEPRWRDALVEARRVLRPGGRFAFEEIVRPGRQALSTLATGRRVPSDFGEAALLAELGRLGFVVVGLERPGWPRRTGLVGDVIGVAAAPG